MHYLDDLCRENLQVITTICKKLGLPLKVEGPATLLIFLGIRLDTLKMEMRLPDAKLNELLHHEP